MVVRTNHACSVEEADDDKAAEDPAGEADPEGLDVLDEALFGWEISVWQICDRVDARLSYELLAQILGIILDHIVVPEDI